jgi:hypothetical protein
MKFLFRFPTIFFKFFMKGGIKEKLPGHVKSFLFFPTPQLHKRKKKPRCIQQKEMEGTSKTEAIPLERSGG